jgi:hypothetical protein
MENGRPGFMLTLTSRAGGSQRNRGGSSGGILGRAGDEQMEIDLLFAKVQRQVLIEGVPGFRRISLSR